MIICVVFFIKMSKNMINFILTFNYVYDKIYIVEAIKKQSFENAKFYCLWSF